MKKITIIGAAAAFAAAAASTIAITISSKEKRKPAIEQTPLPNDSTKVVCERIKPFFVISDAYDRRIILSTDGCLEHYENENLVSSESISGWPTGNFVIEVLKNEPNGSYWFLFTKTDGEGGFRRVDIEPVDYAADHIMLLSPTLKPMPLFDKNYKDSRNEKPTADYPIIGHDCVLTVCVYEPGHRIRPTDLMFFGDGDKNCHLTVVSISNSVYHSFNLSDYKPESRCYYGNKLLIENSEGYALLSNSRDGSNIKLRRCTIHDIDGSHNYKRFVANIKNYSPESFAAFYVETSDTI